ncbi:MAG TPA: HIT domain-containing protein [Acidimicrobiales bacterium]
MPLERFSAAWRESYVSSTNAGENASDDGECVFCVLSEEPINESTGVLLKTSHTFVLLNAFPYGSGHLLILPLRHVAEMEDLSDEEYTDFSLVLRDTVAALKKAYGPDGMNVGMNIGNAAGAGIPKHLHAHALPRWNGDTNFMTTIGETRVLPESLASTWGKVHPFL